ncbi:MAG: YHYH domain-containing protein [Planctomycetes bacterium]|nr:YHYH domain-containing protein [Planctomycetota bacterium]
MSKTTRCKARGLAFSFFVTIALSATAEAHSGRTNSDGCHNDYIHGGYHCHNAPSSSGSFGTPSSGSLGTASSGSLGTSTSGTALSWGDLGTSPGPYEPSSLCGMGLLPWFLPLSFGLVGLRSSRLPWRVRTPAATTVGGRYITHDAKLPATSPGM